MISRLVGSLLLIGALTAGTASAQSWDNSGNGLLSGQYYMRQVVWVLEDEYGDLGEALSVYGVITFDGNGNYSFNGDVYDSDSGLSTYTQTGTYTIAASGYGFMDSLITNDSVYGLVSNGIFIGSTTENSNDYNDLFVAAPIGSSQATNATLSGNYAIADIDNPYVDTEGLASEGYEGDFGVYARDSLTTFTANGNGTLSNVTANGYIGVNGGSSTNQSIGSVKYSFSNGAGNITFSGSYGQNNIGSTLMVANHYIYISPDGNFVFGGNPQGFDIFVGTRVGTGTASNFNGLYYQAGMDVSLTEYGTDPDSYFGSFIANAPAQGQGLGHQRFSEWIYDGVPIDLTYGDSYSFKSGAATDTGTNNPNGQGYVFGNNGAIRIGLGQASVYGIMGISVALQAPPQSGSGVYLNPTGIQNAASYAPFTASLSPGEFIYLYGSGLAPTTTTSNFSGSVSGVQVLMNNTPAPIYVLSPTEIAAVVPFEITPGDIVDIQVNNNGQMSNTISTFAQDTQPGVFTNPADGVSNAAAEHANGSLINSSSPAQIGETIAVYLAGLGAVSPAITDGTPAGTNETTGLGAVVGGVSATVTYQGLAPGFVGLYQMNLTIPSGITASSGNNVNLDITGPDSYSTEAYIPVSGATAAAVSANAVTPHRAHPLLKAKGTGARHVVPERPSRPGFPLKRSALLSAQQSR